MSSLVLQTVHGLVYGMLLFLVASGMTLVFGMMGVMNFAHGAFFMLGAYLCFSCYKWTGSFFLALALAPLVVAFLGLVIERYLLRRVHALGHVLELILTFGVAFILSELIKLAWGTEMLQSPVPDILKGYVFILGSKYPVYRLFIFGFSVIVLGILYVLLVKTRLGIIVRAAVSDVEMVYALGVNAHGVFMMTFALGSWLAGMAGVIAAPFLGTYPALGAEIILDVFVVLVIGGLGSLLGALVSSILIGELLSFGVLLIPKLSIVLMYLLMAVVLCLRPSGLFGERT
jgi:branched-chain amino acid transport system permease protein